ncbi:MAG: DUF3237 domain-containing protein [Acidimicrobiales bacterium]
MALELLPLCTLDVTLADPIVVGEGPAGLRIIYEVVEASMEGARLNAKMRGGASADWITVSGTVGSLDVRATFETEDGAIIYAAYRGRTDVSQGPGAAPIYVAPLFECGDPRYSWLNSLQAVGKGELTGSALHYEWFELR